MGERAGYIPAAVGGTEGEPRAHRLHVRAGDRGRCERWRGWWRIVRADQWGVFFAGALLGMVLPALLYVTFLPRGTDIRGLGIAAALASSVGAHGRAAGWRSDRVPRRLDPVQDAARQPRRHGARHHRHPVDRQPVACARWRGGDVRAVYYAVLGAIVVWGIIALRLAQPIVLLQIGANVAGVVFVIASLHLLYINTRLLPVHCGRRCGGARRSSRWRCSTGCSSSCRCGRCGLAESTVLLCC